jgi:anti-sigma regulatory factor (Ser/Thr protein kinase)
MSAHDDTRLMHALLFYASDGELLGTVVPFLRSGLEAGEAVTVACAGRAAALLRRELPEHRRLAWLDVDDIYTTPAGAIAAYQEIMDDYLSAGVERVRGFGNADLLQRPERWAEWGRYEAVVNHALAQYPLSAICAYDTRLVPHNRLTFARSTHPQLITGSVRTSNGEYVNPADFLRRTTRTEPDELESTPPDLDVAPTKPEHLRDQLEPTLQKQARATEAAADFMIATNEVVTNALRHGRAPVHVRVWLTSERFLCTVTDQGKGFDDPFAGYTWPGRRGHAPTGGMGLWLARRLCDRVDAVPGSQGFTVRLTTEHPRPRPVTPSSRPRQG